MNKDIYQNDDDDEHTGLHEECGVFGILPPLYTMDCLHFSIVDRKAAE